MLDLEPSNTAAAKGLKQIADLSAEQRAKDKKRYAGMFDRLAGKK